MIIEGIRRHHFILVRRSSSVFAPAMLGCDANHLFEGLAILLVGGDVVRDRKAKEEDEGSRPIRRRKTEGEQRQAVIFCGLRKNLVRFQDRFAGSGNNWGKPDVAVSGSRIGWRTGAMENISRLGIPNSGLWTLLNCSGVSGSL